MEKYYTINGIFIEADSSLDRKELNLLDKIYEEVSKEADNLPIEDYPGRRKMTETTIERFNKLKGDKITILSPVYEIFLN